MRNSDRMHADMDALKSKLEHAEQTLAAIRGGQVDALVVATRDGARVLTLDAPDHTYRVMIEAMNEGALTLTRSGAILFCNPRFAQMIKARRENVVGMAIQALVAPGDIAAVELLLLGEAEQQREITLHALDGAPLPVCLSASWARADGGHGVMCILAMDLSLQKRCKVELEYKANYDALTGLANRHRLHEQLAHAIASAGRRGRQLMVAFIDLDQFKFVNDSLGHDIGDQLLRTVAARLQGCLPEGGTVARYGGDEFVIVADARDETVLLPAILAAIARPMLLERHELDITGSIGLAMFPRDGADPATLLKNADAAMYRAKEQGRNNFQFYTQELHQKIAHRLSIESSLRHALERDEFFLVYQPLVEADSGRITGVEALLRWRRGGEVVGPDEFIPLAEEIGLIVPIGEWVLRNACAQNQAWQDAGLAPVRMSVNLSARQFRQKNLADMVAAALLQSGLAARYLNLEITESVVMQNVEAMVATLGELKAMGLEIAIDDFGTGYSSLSYLKRFPIDVLKIDKSFVSDIKAGNDDAAIAISIIALAHSLKLRVVAEGVETHDQFDFLRQHRCDELQGYYFSRPVAAEAIGQLLGRAGRGPAPSLAPPAPPCARNAQVYPPGYRSRRAADPIAI